MFEILLLIGIYLFGLGSGVLLHRKMTAGRALGPVPAPQAEASPPSSAK